MPALLPAEYFKETGRWDVYGPVLFRLVDRKGGDYHLGPTHEEIVTDIARREIRSYRELPKNLYQIQVKFRDEPRPRGGLLRGREFIMKDAYSFDVDEVAATRSYEVMRAAYRRIFDRMGLTYRLVAADSGAIGGSTSAEFQVLVDSGEDAIVACGNCEYAANVEAAELKTHEPLPEAPKGAPSEVSTPTQKTIEEVTKFLDVEPARMLKSLVYLVKEGPLDGKIVMAVVRGDHEVNEIRLARHLGAGEVFLAGDAEVEKATGAAVGFAGPVGLPKDVRLVVDRDAAAVKSAVTGANKSGFHLKDVWFPRDYHAETPSIRSVGRGDPCPNCTKPLESYRGIEAGHIFILGTKYSAKMGATYLDEAQQKKPIVMGCYGIGVSRLVATAIEQHHDVEGIKWPISIAPYHVHLVTIGKDEAVSAAARRLYDDLWAKGIEVLWDDRDERPGVKFKDADLVGLPLRVTVGGKSLAAGNIEMKPRSESDPKKAELVPVGEAVQRVAEFVHKAFGL
jgi:prolyl-tRNA synthetase